MTNLSCKSTVNKLLEGGINYRGYKELADYLREQTKAPLVDIALIRTPEIREKFFMAMVELQRELVPRHIDFPSLYKEVWELFREVVLNKSIYQDSAELENKVSVFSREVKKPLVAFDVIYEIRNFNIDGRHFNLGGVEVFELTSEHLENFSLNEWGIGDDWQHKVVAKVEIDAADSNAANIIGDAEITSALDILRLAIRRESLTGSSDSSFLWDLGNSIVISKSRLKFGVMCEVFDNRKTRPFITDLSSMVEKSLENGSYWRYILDAKLPQDIHRRVMRAIRWISHGIVGKDMDYKLVNLFTALEILLLPEEERETAKGKGALIALRQVLVGQSTYCEPKGIFSLYKLRNKIIHGGYQNITSYSDYIHLLACCVNVLEAILRLSQKYPSICSSKALLDEVENKETLKKFIEDYNSGSHKCRQVKDIAKRLLKKCCCENE